jgi:hypothetical protein
VAITFTFEIAATRPVAAIAALDGTMTANGAWVGVVDVEPPRWHTVPAVLGFTPNLRVHVRVDKVKSIAAQQDDALRLALGLLDHDPGDAVFHRELEAGWFVRKGGALVLSDRTDLWTPERLAWVSHPYTQALIELDG